MTRVVKLHARISLDDALQKLIPKSVGHRVPEQYACVVLSRAIEIGHIRLFVGDDVVDSCFFRVCLGVHAEQDAEGHWRAMLYATRALEKPLDAYTWTLSRLDVRKLLANYDKYVEEWLKI